MSKFLVKTAVCFLITVQILLQPCIALELDLSVDDEIRKNYNPSKLELDALPPLPSISPSSQAPSKPPLEPIEIPAAKPAGNLPPLVPADKKPLIRSSAN